MNWFARESPDPAKQIAKLAPRKVPDIRVAVFSPDQAVEQIAPVSVASATAVANRFGWRNIALGLLALVVVGQAGLMSSWMLSSGAVPATTGSVTVTSSPSESPVTIDGAASGKTPLTISLAAGSHRIEVGSGAQLNGQDLSVTGGGSASLHIELVPVSIPAAPAGTTAPEPVAARTTNDTAPRAPVALATGGLAVTSGFPMQVFERGALVGTSEMARILLPAGAHELELVNAELGYRISRTVEITAGQTTNVGLKPPMGTIAVNALPWAEVWIDGQRVGETPIGNLSIAIGYHEVLFRHPELGEQRRTVTVGAQGPVRVGVEMKKP